MMESKWNPTHYRCLNCNDVIFSRYSGEFVTCKCGAISVDQTQYYTRFIGDIKQFSTEVNNNNNCM